MLLRIREPAVGLRRWTASSVGDGYTSIWHCDPAGRWTFDQSAPAEIACKRYFGIDVERVLTGPIALDWEGDRRLHVQTVDPPAVDWRIEPGSSPVTHFMSLVGSALPRAAWRSRPGLSAMGCAAGRSLGVGTVKLTGTTSNGQPFDANPLRIWFVTSSQARLDGQELGPIGRFFATRVADEMPSAVPTAEVLR